MTAEERAQTIVSAILDMCAVDVGDKRAQLETFVVGHLKEIERVAAEKAVTVYREKAAEASNKVLSETAIGAPNVRGPAAQT
jgi:hypothetical protein